MSKEEYLPVLDENYNIIAKELRSKFHFNPDGKLLHPVIHLHLLNSENQLFLQLRPMDKTVQPGKWDTAVGGHVSFGESIGQSLIRETKEEIGIHVYKPEKLAQYIWETEAEKELVHLFFLKSDEKPQINKNELAGGRFWNISGIQEKLNSGIFTENFIYEFKSFLEKRLILA